MAIFPPASCRPKTDKVLDPKKRHQTYFLKIFPSLQFVVQKTLVIMMNVCVHIDDLCKNHNRKHNGIMYQNNMSDRPGPE